MRETKPLRSRFLVCGVIVCGWLIHAQAAVPATTYYIDGVAGQNERSGTSAETAWRDFTNVNGKTLGAGDRLLIRRGSVINQELEVSARGTPEAWAEIGAYGAGPRPLIRRNWHIDERCVLVRDPDYLRIAGLAVSCAAKGLVVTYTQPGHAGLVIEDCIAYHIEGLYRPNSSGIPEWRDRPGPQGDGLNSSAGIGVVGAAGRDIIVRDCEMFHTSWGFFVVGDDVTLDRIYCHHCYAHNTSPHPAAVRLRNAVMQNCVLDASGGHAFAGTMGIMLVDTNDFTIRNCTFRNMPDSGSHDEGGIDFESRGDRCMIDACTFQNNAGAAIEVLGLSSPQPTNVEIRNSRFIQNNWAHKLGPGEIYIWGKSQPQDPKVCCSNGVIRDNGYVLLPGVEFFVNEAPTLTDWALENNRSYATVEELDRAMPLNHPPVVEAGADISSDECTVSLAGVVRDDARPAGGRVAARWEVLEGAADVAFDEATSPATQATFGAPGDYLLRLVGDDGELWTSDMVVVHVLPPGGALARSWEFNQQLDKEGWAEVDLGTREREEKHPTWPCKSQPVMYVSGGYYVFAVEDSASAHLLSADQLDVDVTAHQTIRIRFQNHTSATSMRFAFTTAAEPAWDAARSQRFDVVPHDSGPREYAIDMSSVPGWRGSLKQLRLDLTPDAAPVTGTCRIDYIQIVHSR